MFRVRDIKNKKSIEYSGDEFMEVCDGAGRMITVLFVDKETGELIAIRRNTPEAYRYERITGDKFSDRPFVITKK